MSRIENSMNNVINGIVAQVISIILSFIVRSVFIIYLNEEYLGISGLFSNIITMLSLVELGLGTAIIYYMYKPLSVNDTKKINALMQLYARVYRYIGIIVLLIGISIIPFMDIIIKTKPDINNLILIYILFLSDTVLSYFYSYKTCILIADQKEYIYSQYKYKFTIIKTIVQILVLIYLKNFYIYLLVQITTNLMMNIFISRKVDKIYLFLDKNNKEYLSKVELTNIKNDVKGLLLTKVGHIMLRSTDNIIISTFLGLKWVGLLSNYTLIIDAIVVITSQILGGIRASVGNFIANEKEHNQYILFNRVDFMNFWIDFFIAICIVNLLNPFINIWLGEKFILNQTIVIVLAINFIIDGMLANLWIFRSTMGLFTQGKYKSIITSIINIILSIYLVKKLGLIGVLLGTTISRSVINLWYDPYIIYKNIFSKSIIEFYIRYIKRGVLFILVQLCISYIKDIILVNGVNIASFTILLISVLIIPNCILYAIYRKSEEYIYFQKTIEKTFINNLIVKFKKIKC